MCVGLLGVKLFLCEMHGKFVVILLAARKLSSNFSIKLAVLQFTSKLKVLLVLIHDFNLIIY